MIQCQAAMFHTPLQSDCGKCGKLLVSRCQSVGMLPPFSKVLRLCKFVHDISSVCNRQPAGSWVPLLSLFLTNPHHMKYLSVSAHTHTQPQPYLSVSVILPIWNVCPLLERSRAEYTIMVHRGVGCWPEIKDRDFIVFLHSGVCESTMCLGSALARLQSFFNTTFCYTDCFLLSPPCREKKKLLADLWSISDRPALLEWRRSNF